MKLIVSENLIEEINTSNLKKQFRRFNIPIDILFCKFTGSDINFESIKKWSKKINDKIILIARCRIENNKPGFLSVRFKGLVDDIGGNLAIVSYNTSKQFPFLCLHECFHLIGLKHCHNKGCIMSLRICNKNINYCVTCKNICVEKIDLCKECLEEFNGRGKRKN